MKAHAQQVYPEECCGLLVGKRQRPQPEAMAEQFPPQAVAVKAAPLIKSVVNLVPLENHWTAQETAFEEDCGRLPLSRRRRYTISPDDMLRVQRESRAQGLDIIGIYHSHPDHPAVPSECDRQLAWPEYAYVIISVAQGQAVDVQNWALDSDHQFHLEPMKLSPSAATDRMPVSA